MSAFQAPLPADAAARRRAVDATASFIVQAPAGSGKTELLIQRLLTLLARVDEPEEIVAITFTRKAASEMRERLIAALRAGESELARAAIERDRQADWRLLEHPARLRIATIDSLSSGFTRAMPWLSRFGAMPEPVEDAYSLYATAASRTLRILGEGTTDSAAIRRLLEHLDNDVRRAEQLIAQMLGRREQWLPLVVQVSDVAALRPLLEANLAGAVQDDLGRLRELAPAELMLQLPRMLKAKRAPQTLAEWQETADLLMTKDGGWRKRIPPESKALERTLKLVIERLNEPLREALKRAREYPEARYNDSQWSVLETLFRVLKLAAAQLKSIFQTRGKVDFVEIAMAALEALGTVEAPTDLALAAGHRVRHLLVDEFQDTSELQHELLLRLTSGWEAWQTLFAVGDPMQSIYRFRQAEVGLFLGVRERGLGEVKLEPLELTANFRSAAQVVEWVNSTFASVFPKEDGAVRYAASEAYRGAGAHPVAMRVLSELDDATEARMVAGLVEEARAERPEARVAILVRARPHLREITAEFDRRGWKYRAVQVTTLAESAVVRDLLALTRALVHLADRPAWLAILRAPWCGLSLADLHAIAGGDHASTIWTLLDAAGLRLSEDGEARLARFKEALGPVMKLRRRVPLRGWVEAAWIRVGGPACLATEAERADAAAYLDLLGEFEEGGDIPEFDRLEWRLRDLFTKPDPAADERLQVMTIHQAKGLEFDTVILPGLGKPPKRDEGKLLEWSNHNGRVLLAPIPAASGEGEEDAIYKYLERHERAKDRDESARLLYVAATRARERLHLIGHARQTKDGPRAVAGSLLEHLWPFVSREMFVAVAAAGAVKRFVQPVSRLPLEWSPAALRAGMKWRRPSAVAEEPEVTFEWVGNTLRHAGVVVHRIIQKLARVGLEAVPSDGEIRAALESLGVPPSEVVKVAERVASAVAGTLEDERGRWTLMPHAEARSELALTAVIDGRVAHVVIDRTFVDDSGSRWIIDYKTSAHEGAGVEAFLDNECARYRGQLELYARVMRIEDSRRPIRMGLYFPLLRAWREVT